MCRGRCTNTPFDPLLAFPAAVLPGGCGPWGCLTLTCPVCLSACRPVWARHPPQAHAQARLCTLNFAGCWQPGRCSCLDALCKSASPHSIELDAWQVERVKVSDTLYMQRSPFPHLLDMRHKQPQAGPPGPKLEDRAGPGGTVRTGSCQSEADQGHGDRKQTLIKLSVCTCISLASPPACSWQQGAKSLPLNKRSNSRPLLVL